MRNNNYQIGVQIPQSNPSGQRQVEQPSSSQESSDYIDENFEHDETDEMWGLPALEKLNSQQFERRHFKSRLNNLKKICQL